MNFQKKARFLFLFLVFILSGQIKASPETASPNMMCNVTWTTTSNSITISGLDAAHVILKLFNPNWSTRHNCFDDCGNPLTLDGLTSGATYHLSYNLYDSNWNQLCEELIDIVIQPSGSNEPDLDLADLQAPSAGDAGSVVNFSVDLKNIGTATASGSYVIGWYLSNNTSLSSDDTRVGVINTGNTPVGTINNVPAAITIPSSFPAGDYYLIGKADINNDIDESNEGNNTIRSAFKVERDNNPNPGGQCGFSKEFTIPDIAELNVFDVDETAQEFILSTTTRLQPNPSQVREVVLKFDKEGNQTDLDEQEFPFVEEPLDSELNVNDDDEFVVTKFDGPNNVQWETEIRVNTPSDLSINQIFQRELIKVHDGYLVVAHIQMNDQNGNQPVYQFSAKLSVNGNFWGQDLYTGATQEGFFRLGTPFISNNSGYVFSMFESFQLSFIKFARNGDYLWKTPYTSDFPSNTIAGVRVSEDENFIYAANRNNFQAIVDKVDTNTGEKIYKVSLGRIFLPDGPYTFDFIQGFLLTSDGGVVAGYNYDDRENSVTGYQYGKIDASGEPVWVKTIPGDSQFDDMIARTETNDGGLLFWKRSSSNNTLSVIKLTGEGELTPTCGDGGPGPGPDGTPLECDMNYTFENGTLTLSGNGLNSPNANIKLYTPTWDLAYFCNSDCPNPIVINNLSNGSHRLSVDLFNNNWSRTCRFTEDLDLGGAANTNEFLDPNYQMLDQGKKIVLQKIYPVPASDQLTIEISSLEDAEINAQVFDARGALVDAKLLSLQSGDNRINWNITNLPSGFYQVLFQSGTRHAPVRFLKQKL